jgi:protein-disulfide isomerase
MRHLFAFTALTVSLLGASTPAAHAAPNPSGLSKADVEAIVRDYIAGHGNEIMDSINAYQQKKQREAVARMVRAYTPTKGPANAPITIIEFADFECPFCYKVEPTILNLQKRYNGQIRWVFKYLPLEFHKNAMPAAQAAAAAHQQGKFWEFAKTLFENQDKLGDKLYTDTAKSLKLDMKKFNADRASATTKANIAQDLTDAASVDARGTPYFLINGEVISGALPEDEFTKIIDKQLAGKK